MDGSIYQVFSKFHVKLHRWQMLEDKVARQDQAIVKILSDLDELKKKT